MANKLKDELSYIEKIGNCKYRIKEGFVPNMKVPGTFYVNDALKEILFEELEQNLTGQGGFLPAVSRCGSQKLEKLSKIILIRLNKSPMWPDYLVSLVRR